MLVKIQPCPLVWPTTSPYVPLALAPETISVHVVPILHHLVKPSTVLMWLIGTESDSLEMLCLDVQSLYSIKLYLMMVHIANIIIVEAAYARSCT
jgi:hypothetical protein